MVRLVSIKRLNRKISSIVVLIASDETFWILCPWDPTYTVCGIRIRTSRETRKWLPNHTDDTDYGVRGSYHSDSLQIETVFTTGQV